LECAVLDVNEYRFAVAISNPDSFLRLYDFAESSDSSNTDSSYFPKNICGLASISNLNGKHKNVIVVGTLGGTIHIWDTYM
jgi:hypothetical protein